MKTDPDSLPYRPCAGVVLASPDGRVFAGERIDTPGAWQMPQGGIDKGETAQQAALRELLEETGVLPSLVAVEAETPDWVLYDLPDHLMGKMWKGKYRGQKQKWVLMRFRGAETDIDIATEHPEFSRWRWMTPGEVRKHIVPFKRSVYDQVFAAFEGQL